MDETGEDYTEMMCISCGEWIDKDLMICSFCDYHYHYVRKLTYHKQQPTPQKQASSPLLKNHVLCRLRNTRANPVNS